MAWTPSRVKRKGFEPTIFIFKGYSATNSTLLTSFINTAHCWTHQKNIWSHRLSNIWPRRTSRPGRNSSHSAPFSCFDPSGTASFSTFHPERRRDAYPCVAIIRTLYIYFTKGNNSRKEMKKNQAPGGIQAHNLLIPGRPNYSCSATGPAYYSRHGFESHHS